MLRQAGNGVLLLKFGSSGGNFGRDVVLESIHGWRSSTLRSRYFWTHSLNEANFSRVNGTVKRCTCKQIIAYEFSAPSTRPQVRQRQEEEVACFRMLCRARTLMLTSNRQAAIQRQSISLPSALVQRTTITASPNRQRQLAGCHHCHR